MYVNDQKCWIRSDEFIRYADMGVNTGNYSVTWAIGVKQYSEIECDTKGIFCKKQMKEGDYFKAPWVQVFSSNICENEWMYTLDKEERIKYLAIWMVDNTIPELYSWFIWDPENKKFVDGSGLLNYGNLYWEKLRQKRVGSDIVDTEIE